MPEVLKIILGVIAIVILIILAVTIYGIFVQKSEIEQAKSSLNQIASQIELMNLGDESSFLMVSPRDWYLVAYGIEDKLVPQRCVNQDNSRENCLCLCPAERNLYSGSADSLKGKAADFFNRHVLREEKNFENYFLQGGECDECGFNKCDREGICSRIARKVRIDNTYFAEGEVNWIDLLNVPREIILRVEGEGDETSVIETKQKYLER